jgi:transmembrane sensor
MEKITDAQIEKFLSGQCSEEEAALVAAYLEQHPDENYLWNEWQHTDNQTALPHGYSAEMEQFITGHTKPKVMHLRWWAAAAACVIALAGSWWVMEQKQTVNKQVAAITPAVPKWISAENKTSIKKQLTLPDGSIIQLFPQAEVTFQDSFYQRKILLKGGAFFDVKKDEQHPFSVQAGALSVNVLGTSFDVLESAKKIQVKLYTGKVVVKTGQKDIYLTTGEEYTYQLASATIDKPTGAINNGNDLQFDNTPLSEVIKQLEKHYHTTIRYDQKDINGKYFTGTILPTDSLKTILSVIANMKNLTVTEEQGGFHIHQ